jgi:hypothetical protein
LFAKNTERKKRRQQPKKRKFSLHHNKFLECESEICGIQIRNVTTLIITGDTTLEWKCHLEVGVIVIVIENEIVSGSGSVAEVAVEGDDPDPSQGSVHERLKEVGVGIVLGPGLVAEITIAVAMVRTRKRTTRFVGFRLLVRCLYSKNLLRRLRLAKTRMQPRRLRLKDRVSMDQFLFPRMGKNLKMLQQQLLLP